MNQSFSTKAVRAARKLIANTDKLKAERGELRRQNQLLRLSARDDQQRIESMVAELHRLRAAAVGSEQRDAQPYRYLFILTYGRTGSTLLQGVLTRTPGFCIRGENGGVVYELFSYHKTAMHHRDRVARAETLPPQHPWWGMDGYPEDLALREFRQLALDTVIRPTVGAHTVGYKEIKWDYPDLHDYLGFMRRVFPGARFVVNTRNLADVSKSKWWAKRPNAMEQLEVLDRQVREAGEMLGDAAYHVHYDDYKDDPKAFAGMFEWLGAPFDLDRVAAVMSQRHSY